MQIMDTPQSVRVLRSFVGAVMFAPLIIVFSRYWHHNLINRDDILWAKNIRKIVVSEEAGDIGRYNFDQKCIFWAVIILLVLLLVSGMAIWRPYFAPAFSIPVIRSVLMLHSFVIVASVVVIMMHIYAALWVESTVAATVEG